MEAAAALPTIPLLSLSRTLKASPESDPRCSYARYYCNLRRCLARYPHPLRQPLRSGCSSPVVRSFGNFDHQRPAEWLLLSSAGRALRGSPPVASPWRLPLASISSASAHPAGTGGGGDSLGAGSGGGDGDGGSSGGGTEERSLAGGTEDVAKLGADVIILDVGGMSCGGCVASVKRILESLPQVSSASVNLTTETAVVWATPEAKATPNWQQELGQKLANHLTTCGFKSSLR
ncbi:hypothetical protein Taro_010557, partial [Colocasia esculenta]|nr:hypothetical protein [Colocasia esculenta]